MRTKETYSLYYQKKNLMHLPFCFLLKCHLLFTHKEPISYINESSFHFLTEVVNKILT